MRQPPKPRTGRSDTHSQKQADSATVAHPPSKQPFSARQHPNTEYAGKKSGNSAGHIQTGVSQGSTEGSVTTQPKPGQTPARKSVGKELRSIRSKLLARPLGGADAARVLGPEQIEDSAQNLAQRQRERQRARRRLALTRSGVVVAIVVAVLTVMWVVFFSSFFALKADGVHVSIQQAQSEGQSGQSAQQSGQQSGQTSAQVALTSAQRVELDDQINQILKPLVGTPLVFISPEDIRAELVSIPRIQDVQVRRSLPGSLDVSIVLRLAALNVRAGSQYQVLGTDGILLETRDSPVSGLPLATIPDSGTQRVEAARQVATIWASLTPQLRERVSSITGNGVTNTLTVDQTRTVIWGQAEDSDTKARVTLVLLGQTGAKTIDVSVPARPVTSSS